MQQLIGPFTELITLENLPDKGPIKEGDLKLIKNGAVWIKNGVVLRTGNFNQLFPEAKAAGATINKLETACIGMPGFIDSHTHICFAGSRAQDYADRNSGKSYLEIARAGGGIWQTVLQTREADADTLTQLTLKRLHKQLQNGITTTEIKSGYGLNLADELKILRAIQQAEKLSPVRCIATCLAAHVKPKDFEGTSTDYLNFITTELLPVIKKEKLAERVDIFIEESAFEPDVSKYFLSKAREMGFAITVHADQFTTGGSLVAVESDALSADHLEASTEVEINRLAKSNTVATVLPGASLGLGIPFAPTRKLLDAGCCLAIASDWNPGSAPMGDLLTQASLLGVYEKLSSTELLAGITFRAARALGLHQLGKLQEGYVADIIGFEASGYQEIFYHQGQLKPSFCWIKGELQPLIQ